MDSTVLMKLEELQDAQIKQTLEPKEKQVVLTPEETTGNKLLTDPQLLQRILKDFEACGGREESNVFVG